MNMRLLAALLLCATTSLAAAVIPRVRHLGDFRGWDGVGCDPSPNTASASSVNNLGIWTVLEDEVVGAPCKGFNGQDVWSLRVEDIEPDCCCKCDKWPSRASPEQLITVFGA